ncbi:unnamed protein product [Owenia fusiformis]|uniref:Signal recognition particle 19 kDa protein n=1 Tax=Owenia fusiformis TaxID=6347 RepID=A0A8S4PAF0_OWEFU|nr:unnamed protein product [Owenia fusiformis]
MKEDNIYFNETIKSIMARSWNPEFTHSDRERWICVYPAYINSKKSISEGRRIPKELAVENPTYTEIRDICASSGLTLGVENKVYPREVDSRDTRFRGRIRVQLKNNDGEPLHKAFPTRQSVLLHIAEMIPKLKSRKENQTPSSSQQQNTTSKKGKKDKKGKR